MAKPEVSAERVDKYVAAAITNLPPRTVQEYAKRGKLPSAAKVGRGWSFDPERLRQYVKQKEEETCRNAQAHLPAVSGMATSSGVGPRLKASITSGAFGQTMRRLRRNAAAKAKRAS
jgi:hypothetical protein